MRITRSTGPTPTGAGSSRAQGASGFTAAASPGPAASSVRSGAAAPVSSLGALLALQEQGGPLERRRRAMARGGRLLDSLDQVKLAMLGGGSETAALDALSRASAEARETVDDEPGLADLLDAIDVRAAVEMAKRERRPTA